MHHSKYMVKKNDDLKLHCNDKEDWSHILIKYYLVAIHEATPKKYAEHTVTVSNKYATLPIEDE